MKDLPSIDYLFNSEEPEVESPNMEDEELPVEGEENPEDPTPEEEEEIEGEADDPDDSDEDESEEDDDENNEDVEEEIGLIDELREMLGYETEEEYEESTEGLVQFFRDTSEKHSEQQLNRIFEEYPLVQTLLEYQLNGGDPDTFVQTFLAQTDYDSIKIGERDHALAEKVLSNEMRIRGYSDEEILEEIEESKTSGRLHKKAGRALEVLRRHQKDEKAQLLEKQKEEAEAQRQMQQKLERQAQDLIEKSNDLRGIPISEKDKPGFVDYLFKMDNGSTKYQKDLQEAGMDVELAAAYLMYRGFDLSGIIDRKSTTKRAESLRQRLQGKKTPGSGVSTKKPSKAKNTSDIVNNLDPSALFSS